MKYQRTYSLPLSDIEKLISQYLRDKELLLPGEELTSVQYHVMLYDDKGNAIAGASCHIELTLNV